MVMSEEKVCTSLFSQLGFVAYKFSIVINSGSRRIVLPHTALMKPGSVLHPPDTLLHSRQDFPADMSCLVSSLESAIPDVAPLRAANVVGSDTPFQLNWPN